MIDLERLGVNPRTMPDDWVTRGNLPAATRIRDRLLYDDDDDFYDVAGHDRYNYPYPDGASGL